MHVGSPQDGLSRAQVLPLVRLSTAAAAQLPADQLRAQIARQPGTRWQLQAGGDLPQAEQAVARLVQLGLPPSDLLLQCRWTAPAELRRLRRAGLQGVAWAVQCIAPSQTGFADLAAALKGARQLGLRVQLRWQLAPENLSALEEFARGDPPALACDELVVAPLLQPGRVVAACDLRRCWPAQHPAGPRIIASQLWPRCLSLAAALIEPSADTAAADLIQPAACQGCPAIGHCLGIPRLVRDACDASPEPWRGSPAGLAPTAVPPRQQVSYDRAAVELRGLRMGLRHAWRLRVAPAEREAFVQEAQLDGWHVAWSPQTYLAHAGGRLQPQKAGDLAPASSEGAHLLVVARSQELAAACVADELALLAAEDPAAEQDAVSAVAAMAQAHRRLGQAYGFPPCCVEAFCDAFGEVVYTRRVGDNAVAVLRAAQRSQRFDRRCFTLIAGLGQANHQPLRHLPCRFDCTASIELASRLRGAEPDKAGGDLAAVVWADGSFAVLDGQIADGNSVVHVRSCSVFGFDPADPSQSPDRRLFASPLSWQALSASPGLLHFAPPPRQEVVEAGNLPWAQEFPLLLLFGGGLDGEVGQTLTSPLP
jgi:hypothetical protein